MSIEINLPENIILKPCITVFGVGGAGCNAVNNMISTGLEGAKFIVANTDAQCLEHSKAEVKIQLGEKLTRGLGAGAAPEVGKGAAEEAIDIIKKYLSNTNMVFITAGMGGGTGTGAAPVIAKIAKELGVLTVGVVTKPFNFEGAHRAKLAKQGLSELQKHVDTLIIIPNQNLFRIANEKTTFSDAFTMADDVLRDGVRSITDLMIMPGLINLDFADIRAVMLGMGQAMMGTGEAEGENRAIVASEAAIANPLLDNSSMKGAKGVLINITGGSDMTLFEVDEAANRIREEVDDNANIIFGSAFNENLEGKIRVSVVATGIESLNNTIVNKKANDDPVKHDLYYKDTILDELTHSKSILGKKNIPESYPENHVATTHVNSSKAQQEFVMPAAEEMDLDSALESEEKKILIEKDQNQGQDQDQDMMQLGSNYKNEYVQKKRAIVKKKKKEGFFTKLKNTMFGENEVSRENQQTNDLSFFEENSEYEKESITDDIIDVPAFLRKKK